MFSAAPEQQDITEEFASKGRGKEIFSPAFTSSELNMFSIP
jgi:hypothetical protein